MSNPNEQNRSKQIGTIFPYGFQEPASALKKVDSFRYDDLHIYRSTVHWTEHESDRAPCTSEIELNTN